MSLSLSHILSSNLSSLGMTVLRGGGWSVAELAGRWDPQCKRGPVLGATLGQDDPPTQSPPTLLRATSTLCSVLLCVLPPMDLAELVRSLGQKALVLVL